MELFFLCVMVVPVFARQFRCTLHDLRLTVVLDQLVLNYGDVLDGVDGQSKLVSSPMIDRRREGPLEWRPNINSNGDKPIGE